MNGESVATTMKVNAFRYPDAPDAEFPQHSEITPLDFRAEALPMSGFCGRANRRSFDKDELTALAERKTVIPAAEAERLGLMSTEGMDAEPINEADLKENMFAAAIVDGVKRPVLKPTINKKRHASKPVRAKMVMSGTKKNKAAAGRK